jgi:hypothetical protein
MKKVCTNNEVLSDVKSRSRNGKVCHNTCIHYIWGVTKRRNRKTERKELLRLTEFFFKYDTLNKNTLYSIKTFGVLLKDGIGKRNGKNCSD